MQFAVIPFVLFYIFYTASAANTPVCTNGFTLINNKCLKLYTTPASHSAAEESCRNVGATLVTVKNENNNQAITTIVGSTASLVWMGLYCLDSDPSKCLWDDGTGSSGMYSNFASARNSHSIGFWVSTTSSSSWPFICKRPAGVQCPPNQPVVTVTPVPNQPSYCNSSLLLAPGVITSPNYPENYDNNLFCSYQLTTLGSYKILLKFDEFITESNDDIVRVYDGDSSDKPLLGTYSGNLNPFSLVSTGNTMYVTFKTDESNVAQGFFTRFLVYSGL
ncbi:hypothetical protein CRE_09482 [Caenorhabditis remanei]|uniref:C-type LECtin n=1 Tax=Caenorhabditis remanei TaxID=31234 RepID=E3MJ34_CAERE|nr:hypothetical protein CRE_09482 [Caenorhabditis remanei]